MTGQLPNMFDWRQRISAELKRDKKKTVILAALLFVAAVVLGRTLLSGVTPQQAKADGVESVSRISEPAEEFVESERQAQAAVREYINQLDHDLKRDMFAMDRDFYPPEVPTERPELQGQAEPDPNQQRRAQQQLMQAQARALLLQSTMISNRPTAIINGRVLRVGEWINGFEVVEITPRSCVVAKNDVRIILNMKN